MKWLVEIFDIYTERFVDKDDYRLLVLDGHDSHVSWQFVMAYYDRRILLLCLFPHITHLLQSLNVIIFESLQKIYDDLVSQESEVGIDSINKDIFINLYTEAREKTFISNVIKAGFKATGLVSFNSQKVLKRFPNRAITSEAQQLDANPRSTSKTLITNEQARREIELLKSQCTSLSLLRLSKLERDFIKIYVSNTIRLTYII